MGCGLERVLAEVNIKLDPKDKKTAHHISTVYLYIYIYYVIIDK